MSASALTAIRGLSLRQKILLPFFLILFLLGTAATIGSLLLITDALYNSTDENLRTSQEIVFREIKEREIQLTSYAALLNYAQALAKANDNMPESTIPQNSLYAALRDDKVSVALYPVRMVDALPYPALRSLLAEAVRSGKPSSGILINIGPISTLAVAFMAPEKGGDDKIILLQTPIDQAFLKNITSGFSSRIFLQSLDGKLLASSHEATSLPALTAADVEVLVSGTPIFKEAAIPLPRRFLFQALPLGTSEMLLVAIELPLLELSTLIRTLATRSALSIVLALALGGYLYCLLIRQIMDPVQELLKGTRAVSEGNLDYRIKNISRDELGSVAESFNTMLAQLENLYIEKVDREKRLTLAKEELKYKEILEQKNRQIARTNRELKANLQEISALFQLNQAMISTLDLGLLFDRMLHVLKDVVRCDETVFLLYHPGVEVLEVRKAAGIDPERLKGVTFRMDEGVTGTAARSQQLQYVPEITTDSRSLGYKGKHRSKGSMVSVPMMVKGRLSGVINLHKNMNNGFSEKEQRLVQAIANQAAIAVENARLYEKTRNLSNIDELTLLANRRHFQVILQRELAQARRYQVPFSLIMADIDHFKKYNDTHGHLNGDVALKRVADLLLQNTRGIDLAARFGGEEFIILLPKTNLDGALSAAEKLRQRIAGETFRGADLSQPGGRLTLSLGVAEFPTDSKDVFELIDLADRALYLAKQAGRNRALAWRTNKSGQPDAERV